MGCANGPVKEVAVATVSSVLAEHVSLRVASVDRLGIAGYIPKLAYEVAVATVSSVLAEHMSLRVKWSTAWGSPDTSPSSPTSAAW